MGVKFLLASRTRPIPFDTAMTKTPKRPVDTTISDPAFDHLHASKRARVHHHPDNKGMDKPTRKALTAAIKAAKKAMTASNGKKS